MQSFKIKKSLDISGNTVGKIMNKLMLKIPEQDFRNNKLRCPGFIVRIDETMRNYKCKSHRGRSPKNKIDDLSIIKCSNGILRGFPCNIPKKDTHTILAIISA
ncbi:hypothetical protein H312_02210 [Anncaliia algerae PRA339]|uniref:ISXO2-like transposase domain-containing protein n=1 Tax=Anncaliia algerae PRA339 TaxID=1288291 RepID=A0A059F063_9MICR|nr:hypothetical protein H312_02210 [Anncaliia algerae PRA339]